MKEYNGFYPSHNRVLCLFICLLIFTFGCNSKKQGIQEIQDEIEQVHLKSDSINRNLNEINKRLDKVSEDSTGYKFITNRKDKIK